MAPKKRLIPPPSGSALPLQPIPGTCVPQLRAGFDVSNMVHDVGKGLIGIPSVSEAVGGCTFAMGPIEWDPEKEIFRSRCTMPTDGRVSHHEFWSSDAVAKAKKEMSLKLQAGAGCNQPVCSALSHFTAMLPFQATPGQATQGRSCILELLDQASFPGTRATALFVFGCDGFFCPPVSSTDGSPGVAGLAYLSRCSSVRSAWADSDGSAPRLETQLRDSIANAQTCLYLWALNARVARDEFLPGTAAAYRDDFEHHPVAEQSEDEEDEEQCDQAAPPQEDLLDVIQAGVRRSARNSSSFDATAAKSRIGKTRPARKFGSWTATVGPAGADGRSVRDHCLARRATSARAMRWQDRLRHEAAQDEKNNKAPVYRRSREEAWRQHAVDVQQQVKLPPYLKVNHADLVLAHGKDGNVHAVRLALMQEQDDGHWLASTKSPCAVWPEELLSLKLHASEVKRRKAAAIEPIVANCHRNKKGRKLIGQELGRLLDLDASRFPDKPLMRVTDNVVRCKGHAAGKPVDKDTFLNKSGWFMQQYFVLTQNPVQYGVKVLELLSRCRKEMEETPPRRSKPELAGEICAYSPIEEEDFQELPNTSMPVCALQSVMLCCLLQDSDEADAE
ncbi:unnamed protein product [Symbiodinium sp. KB8]|nr:unnamed protein product [Symbiodinium sp. KB8]